MGSICGGIIKESEFQKRLKKKNGIYGIMMCFILPDDQYDKYWQARKNNDKKTAQKIFKNYARSII